MASNRTTFSRDHGPAGSTLSQGLLGASLSWLSVDVGPWLYVLTALCMVSLLAFAHLGQASYVAQQVEDMEMLENDVHTLKRSNNSLRLQIARYEQMERIKQQAQMRGLGKPEGIEYLQVPVDEASPPAGEGAEANIRLSLEPTSPHFPAWLHGVVGQFTTWMQTARLQPGH
jgi:hypothetical protein